MAQPEDQAVLEEAIAWHLRLQTGDSADWDGFVAWLEGDPSRSAAFDRVEAGHAALTPSVFPPLGSVSSEAASGPSRRNRVWATGVAAALVLALVFSLRGQPGPDLYTVSTGAGEQRTLALAGGGTVALNGDTALRLDRNDARFAELQKGEAAFSVTHDADHPFVVVVGGNRIEDAGTVFNVVSDPYGFGVEVAEGSVVYDPRGQSIALAAGQTLRRNGGGEAVLGTKDAKAVGSWRNRQLSYVSTPLARVAEDVSRTQGVKIEVANSLAGVSFTGSLRISDDPGATASDLAAASGLSASKIPNGWLIER